MTDKLDRPKLLARAIDEAVEHYRSDRELERGEAIAAIAAAVSVSARTVTRWTTGDAVPDLLQAVPLADELKVSPWLFIEPPEAPPYPISEYLVRQVTAEATEEAIRLERRRRRRPGGAEESAA